MKFTCIPVLQKNTYKDINILPKLIVKTRTIFKNGQLKK